MTTATAFTVTEPLPKAMDAGAAARAFGMTPATFRRHRAAGEFRPFELPRPIGAKRYSGEKVQAFLNGRK